MIEVLVRVPPADIGLSEKNERVYGVPVMQIA